MRRASLASSWRSNRRSRRRIVAVLEPQHARCLRIFDLQPVFARPGTVWPRAIFRDDALAPEFAGMDKDQCAVVLEVLGKADARLHPTQQPMQRRFALEQRLWSQILPVQLEEIEGKKERDPIMLAAMHALEIGDTGVIAGRRLAGDRGIGWQRLGGRAVSG